jgi:hypothetical protein
VTADLGGPLPLAGFARAAPAETLELTIAVPGASREELLDRRDEITAVLEAMGLRVALTDCGTDVRLVDDRPGTSRLRDLEAAVVAAWSHVSGQEADPVPADVLAEHLDQLAAPILERRPELGEGHGRRQGWRQ